MAVCSCFAGVMWHCRTAISSTSSFVKAEMLKSVIIDISRHTAFTGHLSPRSCRQYIKPTLVCSIATRCNLKFPLCKLLLKYLFFYFPFLKEIKKIISLKIPLKLIVTFALRAIKPTLCCITLTHKEI